MIMFLGILGELITVMGSSVIAIRGTMNSTLTIYDHGYKIDKDAYEQYWKNKGHHKKNGSKIKRFLSSMLFFVPGVNLLYATVYSVLKQKKIMDHPDVKAVIVPMSDQERNFYNKLKDREQKLIFVAATATKENDNIDIIGIYGNTVIAVQRGVTRLNYPSLVPLAYTFDEVKKLNDVTNYSYKIGKVDGINVAIIGIPNLNHFSNKIQFHRDSYHETRVLDDITDEEAKDLTFVVYSFSTYDEEAMEKCIDDIRDVRKNGKTKSYGYHYQGRDSMIDKSTFNYGKGLVLKKKR